jgi:hypothetical protein
MFKYIGISFTYRAYYKFSKQVKYTFTPLTWITLLGFVALTMNSGPMQVLGLQYFAWGCISLDDDAAAAAARYSLDGALCTGCLLPGCPILVFSEQL